MDRLASMETFTRVVETGSFSGAARQLRVGQPAVSKTVVDTAKGAVNIVKKASATLVASVKPMATGSK